MELKASDLSNTRVPAVEMSLHQRVAEEFRPGAIIDPRLIELNKLTTLYLVDEHEALDGLESDLMLLTDVSMWWFYTCRRWEAVGIKPSTWIESVQRHAAECITI